MEDSQRAFKTPNLFREFKSRNLFRKRQSESENDTQSEGSRDCVNARLGFENREFASRSWLSVSDHAVSSTKQVYLYKWFLIRVAENISENDKNHNGVQVAVGGYTTSDLLDNEKFTTAPIESRIEKDKLRTVDGLNILLMSAIDEQRTYANGFPFQVIYSFIIGFPFNWNHVINLYLGKLHLSPSVLSSRKPEDDSDHQKDEALNSEHARKQIKGVGTGKLSLQERRKNMSKVSSSRESSAESSKRGKNGTQLIVFSAGGGEDNTYQQAYEFVNSEHVGKQVESVEAGKLSFQEPGENKSKAEENMSNVTSPRESSAKGSKRGKCKIQPIRSSKRLKYNRLNFKSVPGTPSPLVDSNVLRESAIYLSSICCTESVKKEVKIPQPKFSDVETHEQTDMDDNLMITVHHTENVSVKGKKNDSKSAISQSIKGNRVSKNQIDCTNKLTDSAQTVNITSISENQTNSHSSSAKDGAKQGRVNKETEQSPIANVLLDKFENKCTSGREQTLDIQIPALEVPETICKKSTLRSKVKLSSKRDGRNVHPSLPKGILCNEITVTECVNKTSDVKHATHRSELLPIPPPRVKTTSEEVSKAFGLKTSRSGRLIVPPLAHWCNQTIAYDLDGGIIAILDGSSEREVNESAFNYKSPQQKDAVKIRHKLCNAANEIIRTPSHVKKTRKDCIF